MNLKETMSTEGQQAAINLIKADLAVQTAQKRFEQSQTDLVIARQKLSDLWSECDEKDQPVFGIPDSFVTYYGGQAYLLRVDGNAEWEVEPIDGILGILPEA